MTARSRSWCESRTVAKQNGCSFQETGRSMFAVPTMGPLGVTKIKLTNEPGGSSDSGAIRPPVRETQRSFPETRCPSRQRRTMGVSSASRNLGERLSGSTWGSRVNSQSSMFGVPESEQITWGLVLFLPTNQHLASGHLSVMASTRPLSCEVLTT